MMTALVDRLIDWGLTLATWATTAAYPFVRSKTGYDNPRVRHLVGLTYQLHDYWIIRPNIQKWLAGREPLFPAAVQVQTVNRCNAQCGMCPYPYTVHLQPRHIMPDELFTKIAAECASEPDLHEFVPMAQNEPLMDPKLEQRVAEFKAISAPHQMVEIVTNGSALSLARFNRLVQSGVDLITVSLSAHTEAAYQKVMQGLSWPLLMKNLNALAGAHTSRVNLFLRYVHQAENEGQYPAYRKHWTRRGFNIFAYEINNRSGTVNGFARRVPLKSWLFTRLRRVMGRKYFKVCPHAFSIAHVLANGDVPLCANDWENRELLGNVKDNTLRTIYNSPRIQAIRELMRQGRYDEIAPCRDCSFRKEWLPA
jgi:radical SAM protein with 4Fe4S-binding SPASM domain